MFEDGESVTGIVLGFIRLVGAGGSNSDIMSVPNTMWAGVAFKAWKIAVID
jgi:hypothetical protein